MVGCDKKIAKPQPSEPPKAKKLAKVTMNDADSIVFNYSSSGMLQKIISTEYKVNDKPVVFNLSYDAAGNTSEVNSSGGTRYNFIYQENKLILIENYLNGKKVAENNIGWLDGKVGSKTIFTGKDTDNGGTLYNPTFQVKSQYDGEGRIAKLSSYTIKPGYVFDLVSEKVINQYHNSENPLHVLSSLDLIRFEQSPLNNILKETLYNEKGEVDEITVNSYVFDNDNYVISAISVVTETGYSPTTISFKYFYE